MISIVMAYYNRKQLLLRTLQSIALSAVSDREIIVVDDGSREEERVEDLIPRFPGLRVLRVDPATKKHMNPCIPFNLGFDAARGDIVILQNPECLHAGDVLAHVLEHLGEGAYLSYAAYSADAEATAALGAVPIQAPEDLDAIRNLVAPAPHAPASDGAAGWYNHPVHNRKGYHFCSAIRKTDLDAIGGFDERFAEGMAFDDDEILIRILRYGLDVRIVEAPYVIHQFHGTGGYWSTQAERVARNRALVHRVQHERGWKAHRGWPWPEPASPALERIPVVTVSYNAPDLVREVLSSFRRFYGNPYHIIDGSDPGPLAEITRIAADYPGVELHAFGYNIHHGPGLAWAITNLPLSGPVLFLDSDISILRPGFLESLAGALRPGQYGVGDVGCADEHGHEVPPGPEGIPYLHPACMLCNIEEMRQWPLPVLHGAPMLPAMIALKQAGCSDLLGRVDWVRNDFGKDTERVFLAHDWQGTVLRTGGYHLGAAPAPQPGPPQEGPHTELLRFLPAGAQSLIEVGRGEGPLAAAYRQANPQGRYRGLEADLEAEGDAFYQGLTDPTCWVFDRVLETLRDPGAVLARIRKVLPQGGCVVACLPNAQHWLLQARLAIGDLRYGDGVAPERTNLRWFTRATMLELFQASGFKVTGGAPCIAEEPAREPILPLIRAMATAVGADPELAVQDSLATHYIIKAEPAP